MDTNLAEKKLIVNKSLTCHNGTICNAVETLHVKVELQPQGALYLGYELTGDLTQLRIPAPQLPSAIDGLWEHTCFEVFITAVGETNYYEFNFSPSGQWAAYAFSDYRVRRSWMAGQAPVIRFTQNTGHLLLEAVIAAADLLQNGAGKPFQLGLTAVIEANDGNRTYWALHHPEPHPDFHHRGGFILSLNETDNHTTRSTISFSGGRG